MIDNPAYKGPWKAPKISNPDYKEDPNMYKYKSGGVFFDLWQVKSGTIFDDIIVTDSIDEAKAFAEETYLKKKDAEEKSKKALDEEAEKKKAAEEEERKKNEPPIDSSDNKEMPFGDEIHEDIEHDEHDEL